jgi:hypothetical protein
MEMDRAESDRNGFFYFVKALEILSMDAEAQCEATGNYNMPWEIQHDVADYAVLAESPTFGLTSEQQRAIGDISRQLLILPMAAIAPDSVSMTTHSGCVAGMRHPDWELLRAKAKLLLALLEPVIAENRRYLNLP